ncbi:type II toxin-antitoxin system RelE/ParE family toxin [Pantoea cypripedii]|uniref:type II toxin-antitoxin system RelE/ParE family toxin n=1 Tax=Pantoea cypripedii TaxID=55209 RepID=UPI000A10C712|nr:type II toxin-antitoxin system RelE/ParE family toxin [Pantoea cypripedii]
MAKGRACWIYIFQAVNQDMANIDTQELSGFRELAKHYAALSDQNITALMKIKELVEICHDCKN